MMLKKLSSILDREIGLNNLSDIPGSLIDDWYTVYYSYRLARLGRWFVARTFFATTFPVLSLINIVTNTLTTVFYALASVLVRNSQSQQTYRNYTRDAFNNVLKNLAGFLLFPISFLPTRNFAWFFMAKPLKASIKPDAPNTTVHTPATSKDVAALIARLAEQKRVGTKLRVEVVNAYAPAIDATRDTEIRREIIDARSLNHISINSDRSTVCVGRGATWLEIANVLNAEQLMLELAPADFNGNIGDALSANSRATKFRSHCIVDSVSSVTIVNASGELEKLTRADVQFKYVLGGWDLFGVIVEAELFITTSQIPTTMFTRLNSLFFATKGVIQQNTNLTQELHRHATLLTLQNKSRSKKVISREYLLPIKNWTKFKQIFFGLLSLNEIAWISATVSDFELDRTTILGAQNVWNREGLCVVTLSYVQDLSDNPEVAKEAEYWFTKLTEDRVDGNGGIVYHPLDALIPGQPIDLADHPFQEIVNMARTADPDALFYSSVLHPMLTDNTDMTYSARDFLATDVVYTAFPLEHVAECRDASCDVITGFAGLHNLSDQALDSVLPMINRVLKIDGSLLLVEHDVPAHDADKLQAAVCMQRAINFTNGVSLSEQEAQANNFKELKDWQAKLFKYGFELRAKTAVDKHRVLIKFTKVAEYDPNLPADLALFTEQLARASTPDSIHRSLSGASSSTACAQTPSPVIFIGPASHDSGELDTKLNTKKAEEATIGVYAGGHHFTLS